MEQIRLVHVADVHLGYTGPAYLVHRGEEDHAGRYVREVDIERSFDRLARFLITESPRTDLLVIAGDLFHRSTPLPRAVACAATAVQALVNAGIDVVIIDGNHETSNSLHTGSPSAYLSELGVHVVNGREWRIVMGDDWHNERLRHNLAVHALPYLAMVSSESLDLYPIPGVSNVLVAHGPVAGMDYARYLPSQRELLPVYLLDRAWDYVALGDWHVHMEQPVEGVPAFYSGSLEAMDFGEAASYPPDPQDRHAVHGAIDVRLNGEGPALVSSLPNLGRRPILDLTPVRAVNLTPANLLDMVRERLSSPFPPDALVRLCINECPVSLLEDLDRRAIEHIRRSVQARHCIIKWDIRHTETRNSEQVLAEITLEDAWRRFVEEEEPEVALRERYTNQGLKQIEAARTA